MKKTIIDGVDISKCKFYSENLSVRQGSGFIGTAEGYGFCTHNIKGLDKADVYVQPFARCWGNECYYKQIQKLEEEFGQYKKYKFLFEKAKEFKEQTDKWAQKCLAENEDLKDSLRRTVCQAECYKHKEAERYKKVLAEIKEISEDFLKDVSQECANVTPMYEVHKQILQKIKESE